ncbi:hypothetical protein AB5I41_05150 [Sphingomonas sp. MMS24-JH45]
MLALVEALDPVEEALDVHFGTAAARAATTAMIGGEAEHRWSFMIS